MSNEYVHGYSYEEAMRLNDQADSLSTLLHHDSKWAPGSLILEAGCGVGAQTKTIAPANPESKFISVDISQDSVIQAKAMAQLHGINNVTFQQGDLFNLDFPEAHFDHIFVCFVLEHLPDPVLALNELKKLLKPGGTITVIEGDHGSTYFYPESDLAQAAVQCQVSLQARNGGDANIGRRLYPLLEAATFDQIRVSPRQVYVDDSNPRWVEGFTRNTFTAMIKGVRKDALANQLMNASDFDQGIKDLYRTSEGGGTFCYTFFKAVAVKETV
ncbi:MAG: methyltransferase domain-containing protein [Bacteroidota bacterium]